MEYERQKMDNRRDYCFFWRSGSPFSNFHPAEYEYDGNVFTCSEQGFMHSKAVLFGDHAIAEEILKTTSPMKIKQLGRQVRGFKEKTWKNARVDIMYQHCFAKFAQNEHLKEALMRTKDKAMVEASPSDAVWGIGLNEDKARRRAPETWRGQNLLGQVLDRVREELREIQRISDGEEEHEKVQGIDEVQSRSSYCTENSQKKASYKKNT